IAIRPNVHDDFEPEIGILKSTSYFLPTRRTLQQITREKIAPIAVIQCLRLFERLAPAAVRLLENDSGKDLQFGLGIVFNQPDLRFHGGLGCTPADELAYGPVAVM